MFCNKCAKPLRGGDQRVCPNCGSAVPPPQAFATRPANTSDTPLTSLLSNPKVLMSIVALILAAIALENLHQVAALIGVIFIVVAAVAAFRWHVAPKRKLLALGIGVVCILGVNAIEGSVESRPPVKSKTVSAAPQDLRKSHNEVALDQPIHVEIDLPKLALARKTAIDKILGPPTKTQNETNTLDLPISVVQYKRAECTFFRDRLVS